MVSRRQSVGVRRPGPAERHQADIDQSIKAVVDADIRIDQTFQDVHYSGVRLGKGGVGRGWAPRGALGQINADAALIDAPVATSRLGLSRTPSPSSALTTQHCP
jgi:hypothetical protein